MPELARLLPFVAIALIFWLLVMRPASRRQKEIARLQAGLGVGDKVMLSSGIYGVIGAIAEDRVHVQVADGVVLEVARGAVASVDREPARNDPTDPTPGTVDGTGA
ncbi:preprotein translocase subunit YajC [uncultured Nocardioides sp.]|uniref:preprotein translocase subunit YajC n=1 Tax=uncultured Nocardioides sp. TaxID=198441 RepID=UPI0025FAFF53|nr:preprotein translocase subunit YajC [uncultured Nocardioides sp.]